MSGHADKQGFSAGPFAGRNATGSPSLNTTQIVTADVPVADIAHDDLTLGQMVEAGIYRPNTQGSVVYQRVTSQGEPIGGFDDFGVLMFGEFAKFADFQAKGFSLYAGVAEVASSIQGRNVIGSAQRARASTLGKILSPEGTLRTSGVVARELSTVRQYIPVQAIVDTVKVGVRAADPQKVAGQFMYRAPAAFGQSRGILEVLVHEPTGQIRHVLFRSLFK